MTRLERVTQAALPTGGRTEYEYFPHTLTTKQTAKLADNTIVGQTTSTANGRGQALISKVLTGVNKEVATKVKYDKMGRRWQVSNPYLASGSPTKWTTYSYDELSRLTKVAAPDGSEMKNFYNEAAKPSSAQSTAGTTVRREDAWGRERWIRMDAFGRLVEVVEPASNKASVMGAGNLPTRYSYDAGDQLVQTTQGAQVRKFKYDALGRLTRQKSAEQTATINDAGVYVGAGAAGAVWSEAFKYDVRSNLIERVDARGVKTKLSYLKGGVLDPLNRLQSVEYDKTGADTTRGTIHEAADITYNYMTTGDLERIDNVVASGASTERYTYDADGRVTNYRMELMGRTSYPLEMSYIYDAGSRLTEVRYPAAYGKSGSSRRRVSVKYDETSRLKELQVDSVVQMDQIVYNDYGQTTSLRVGGAGVNALTETYEYNADNGLLTRQKVKRGTTFLMDMSYGYARNSTSAGKLRGKTGSLTSITNNLDKNQNRIYSYDALGRLIRARAGRAAGGGTAAMGTHTSWHQGYKYDRYGNRVERDSRGVPSSGGQSAPINGITGWTYDSATNRITTANHEYDNGGNMVRGRASGGVVQRYEYDEAGRLVKIKTDAGVLLEEYGYGRSRERIKKTKQDGSKVYYAWGGSSVLAEYEEGASATVLSWTKSYVYAGSRLLSTITKTGSTETTEYHHPDRLGTKLVTTADDGEGTVDAAVWNSRWMSETTTPQANNGVGPSNSTLHQLR